MTYVLDLKRSFLDACTWLAGDQFRDLATILWVLLPILSIVIVATLGVLVIVWLERKISAGVQQRVGPEYGGALGLLQSLADGLKLIFKEDVVPAKSDAWLFTLGPAVVVVPVF